MLLLLAILNLILTTDVGLFSMVFFAIALFFDIRTCRIVLNKNVDFFVHLLFSTETLVFAESSENIKRSIEQWPAINDMPPEEFEEVDDLYESIHALAVLNTHFKSVSKLSFLFSLTAGLAYTFTEIIKTSRNMGILQHMFIETDWEAKRRSRA